MGEPFCATQNAIKAIAMKDEESLAVCGLVSRLVSNLHTCNRPFAIMAKCLIVISRDVDDAGSRMDLGKDFLQHSVMRRGPVPSPLQPPAIDNVADKKERFTRIARKKIRQLLGFAAACAQMRIRNKNGAVVPWLLSGPLRRAAGPSFGLRGDLADGLRGDPLAPQG